MKLESGLCAIWFGSIFIFLIDSIPFQFYSNNAKPDWNWNVSCFKIEIQQLEIKFFFFLNQSSFDKCLESDPHSKDWNSGVLDFELSISSSDKL